jgi:AraC-like DNA-binding protein
MDPLTDLLPAMRVHSAVYTRVDATAPWGIDFIPYHHVKFGIVLHGSGWINLADDTPPVALSAGDCYLLPRGCAFTLRDRLDSPTQNFEELLCQIEGRTLRYGGGGELTTIIGGRFIFQGPRYPALLDVLPELVHFKVTANELTALQSTIQLLAAEIAAPVLGSSLILDRLADIFFVQTLRAYLGSGNGRDVRWFGAAADHQIGSALRALHEKSAHAWTIEALAGTVNMSRSAFALRFKTLIGEAPMEYLARCRIQKASRLLHESDLTIRQIADSVGYESETSFNKAFKRRIGVPPGRFREQRPDRHT